MRVLILRASAAKSFGRNLSWQKNRRRDPRQVRHLVEVNGKKEIRLLRDRLRRRTIPKIEMENGDRISVALDSKGEPPPKRMVGHGPAVPMDHSVSRTMPLDRADASVAIELSVSEMQNDPAFKAELRERAIEAALQKFDDDKYKLEFNAQRCAYYHGMRGHFFDFWGKFLSLLAFVFGSASFVSILSTRQFLLPVFTVFTTFFSGLNLIIGFATKAREHYERRSKYYTFISDLKKVTTPEELLQFESKMQLLYSDGPLFFSALDAIARNRTIASFGAKSGFDMLTGSQRWFCHFLPFNTRLFKGE
jgi:hypothetical protein